MKLPFSQVISYFYSFDTKLEVAYFSGKYKTKL
jgi:hypothetical protein